MYFLSVRKLQELTVSLYTKLRQSLVLDRRDWSECLTSDVLESAFLQPVNNKYSEFSNIFKRQTPNAKLKTPNGGKTKESTPQSAANG